MSKRAGRSSLSLKVLSGDIDCINDLEFLSGDKVLPWAMKLSTRLAAFRGKMRRAGLPVIYVNDNFGQWRSHFGDVYQHCIRKGARGREVSRRLKPGPNDYFILKPRHSGFFSTSLLPLLEDLKIKRLILSGIATNLCVLFTAHDAHMHRYPMVVLSNCCAAESDFDHNVALSQLEKFCGAEICLSKEVRFSAKNRGEYGASMKH
ncbi:MAG TPA: isochorismatase family cysteine hydrolase [Tepidisphaeraceae bacterium]|nr:isochorismatase family cysteine hydrolase [Tepidisphaeraceae bacterium]